MSKRFKSTIDEETMSIMPYLVSDNEEECFYNLEGCVDLLNEQQATINKLNDENRELRNIIKQKEKEEKLYAKEILRLNELNKQTSEFTDILGGY